MPDLIVDDNTIQVWCKHNNRAITSIKGKCMIIPSSFNQNTTTKAMFRLTYNHKYYFYWKRTQHCGCTCRQHIVMERTCKHSLQKHTIHLRYSEEFNTLHTLAYCATVWDNAMGTMKKNNYITEKSCSCHIYRCKYTYIWTIPWFTNVFWHNYVPLYFTCFLIERQI